MSKKLCIVNDETVLKNIQILRKSKGYSQADMAKLIGTSQSAYARFELGVKKTDLEMIDLIAQVLEMSLIDVLTYPDKYVNIKNMPHKDPAHEPDVVIQIEIKKPEVRNKN
jgi:transcriptional regulator with XRE-family HTH domain